MEEKKNRGRPSQEARESRFGNLSRDGRMREDNRPQFTRMETKNGGQQEDDGCGRRATSFLMDARLAFVTMKTTGIARD